MDLLDGVKLITKALEKADEDKSYQFYVSNYIYLEKKVPFNEYYKKKKSIQNRASSNQSVEEILNDVKNTLSMLETG